MLLVFLLVLVLLHLDNGVHDEDIIFRTNLTIELLYCMLDGVMNYAFIYDSHDVSTRFE
jgi:hypothetical protein